MNSNFSTELKFAVCAIAALTAILVLVALVPALHFTLPSPQTLALHILLETVSIAISVLVFVSSWHASGRTRRNIFGLAPLVFIGVALLDFVYMLTYKGMPVFAPPYAPGQAILFFLAARVLAALGLVAIAVIPSQREFPSATRKAVTLGATVFAGIIIWIGLFRADWLPLYLVPGLGLTATKVWTGYVIIALNLVTVVMLYRNQTRMKSYPVAYLMAAAAAMALSEFFFTLYSSTTDQFFHLAHLYKAIAYLLIYRAIFVENVRLPFMLLRQSEATATEGRERLASVIDSAIDAVICVDEQHRIVVFNRAAETMFIYKNEEIMGRSLNDLLPKRYRAGHDHLMAEFSAENIVSRNMGKARDIFGLRSNGEEFPIEVSISKASSNGIPILTVILRDVTVRERARRALLASQDRFEKAFNLGAVGMCVVTLDDGRILDVNPAVAAMFGYTREEMMGRTTLELGLWLDPAARQHGIEHLLSGGRAFGVEAQGRGKSGRIIDVRRYMEIIEVEGRQCYLTVMLDITTEKHREAEIRALNQSLEDRVRERTKEIAGLYAERELRVAELETITKRMDETNRELTNANSDLEAFSYTVAHDLRAPLRTIDGFSALLAESWDASNAAEGKRFIDRIQSRARHMNMLIDDLLELARTSRVEMQSKLLDCRACVDEIIENVDAGKAKFRFEIGELPSCKGDERLMKQVWFNLISNAMKYSAKVVEPVIQIGFERGAYFVRDNGAGFDMAFADRLFRTFSRLHTAHDFEGTGMGLAIVKRIVDRHGGQIRAEGRVGEGAKFSFTIPSTPSTPSVASGASGA